MKIVLILRKSCFLAVTASKAWTGPPRDSTLFLLVQSLKNPESPAVNAPIETLAELDGPHMSGCPLLSKSLSPINNRFL